MNLLAIENLTKVYTERRLFDGATFYMEAGDKAGLIGINGTGKSTLLKIVAGMEEADNGEVRLNSSVSVGYLPQIPLFEANDTVISSILRPFHDSEESWEVETKAKIMLTKLGIYDFEAPVRLFSGGQRKRVALAAALLGKSDFLILDEPTNHLDSEMTEWLEGYLRDYKGSVLMITHDRYFLDSVTNRIVELDDGKLYSYDTNYSGFLERKALRESVEVAAERKRQSILKKEIQWMMRGARARSTKQKARIQRFEELKNQEGLVADEKVEMSSIATRLGRSTIEIEAIKKAYGDNLLIDDFTYTFLKNDRIGIIGKNGAGKTTLLRMIVGQEASDEGTISIGQTVKIGYFSQENEFLNENQKVIDCLKEVGEYVQTADGTISASQMLERFLFPASVQYSLIGKLSGGEKRRLYLLQILMDAPNVLILDEPTNDLDIQTLTILEDYLDDFPGIVITVSHDRYFLDRTVRRIFALEAKGQVVQYEGGYSDYLLASREREQPKEVRKVQEKKEERVKPRSQKLKFSYQEQRDFDEIEGVIDGLEEKLAQLEEQMVVEASNYERLGLLMKEKEETEAILEEKMDRWMYLEDLKQRIDEAQKK